MIRAATDADVPVVMGLWNRMIHDPAVTFTTTEKTLEGLTALLKNRDGAFLVAEDAGKCTGFVTWGPFRAGPGYVHTAEHSIITASSGRGTGRALMEAAIAQARTQRIHVMVAGISGDNAGAIAFHRRLGFAIAGQLPQVGRKLGRWHDLILMSRIIYAPDKPVHAR